jgi:hypothetical protein
MTGGVTQTGPSTFVKTSGTNGTFDGQVYSQQGYARGVYVTATASQADSFVIFGLNSDPAADASFASTDYAWYILGDGPGTDYQCEIRENGIYVSAHGSHIGSTFTITYDGANIRYFKGGSLIRTVARAIGSALYLDSSFSNVGGGLTSLNFGPMGEVGGATTITATNDTTTTTLYPVMVGAAGSSEVPKVTTTKLSFNASSGSLSAINTSFSGTMTLPCNVGSAYIKAGTGDGASFTQYNLKINSHWGIGFGDYQDLSTVKAYLNTREGSLGLSGNLTVSAGNATGGGIILADDGDIVDLNDGYCSMRFSSGVRVFSGNRTGSAVVWLMNTGEIRASSEVTAYYVSDRNLKTNIVPIENALDKLKQVSGVMFDWKDEEVERRGGEDGYFVRKHDTGIIAQEVEAVLPEVVATREDGFKAVRYEKLAGIIIQAINELADQVEDIKRKL